MLIGVPYRSPRWRSTPGGAGQFSADLTQPERCRDVTVVLPSLSTGLTTAPVEDAGRRRDRRRANDHGARRATPDDERSPRPWSFPHPNPLPEGEGANVLREIHCKGGRGRSRGVPGANRASRNRLGDSVTPGQGCPGEVPVTAARDPRLAAGGRSGSPARSRRRCCAARSALPLSRQTRRPSSCPSPGRSR